MIEFCINQALARMTEWMEKYRRSKYLSIRKHQVLNATKLPYISQNLMTGGTNQLSHDSLIVAFTAPCTRICRLGTGHLRVYIKKLSSATYTSIHSLKCLVFKPSTTHRVSHSDFLSKTRRRSRRCLRETYTTKQLFMRTNKQTWIYDKCIINVGFDKSVNRYLCVAW